MKTVETSVGTIKESATYKEIAQKYLKKYGRAKAFWIISKDFYKLCEDEKQIGDGDKIYFNLKGGGHILYDHYLYHCWVVVKREQEDRKLLTVDCDKLHFLPKYPSPIKIGGELSELDDPKLEEPDNMDRRQPSDHARNELGKRQPDLFGSTIQQQR